jgi:hypothetical protein
MTGVVDVAIVHGVTIGIVDPSVADGTIVPPVTV